MKLFVDIGNTAIKFATNENGFSYLGRFFTRELSEEKLDALLANVKNLEQVNIASVVPSSSKKLNEYFNKKYHLEPRYIKIDDYPALKVDIDNKNELGMDLYCDLVGAYKKYGPATIVVDLGTASKILLIDKEGVFHSCSIVPGIEMSKKMLSSETALLPNVDSGLIKNITECRNTVEVITSSVYFGHVEMINGLLKRFEKEIGYTCKRVFTGGNAKEIVKNISEPYVLDENLCLEGIKEIVE